MPSLRLSVALQERFSQTYDISGFGGGDFSIADVSNVLAVFTVNAGAAGDGAISIDNFNMTAVPEPSSTASLRPRRPRPDAAPQAQLMSDSRAAATTKN